MILLYDNGCGFCQWMMWLILRHDRRGAIRPVPIQSPTGEDLLADLDPEARLASWHAVEPSGRRSSGGDAFAPVLRAVPRLAPLGRIVALLPGPLLRGGYDFVARRRAVLGRLVPQGAKRTARERIAARGGSPAEGGACALPSRP